MNEVEMFDTYVDYLAVSSLTWGVWEENRLRFFKFGCCLINTENEIRLKNM